MQFVAENLGGLILLAVLAIILGVMIFSPTPTSKSVPPQADKTVMKINFPPKK